MQGERRQRGRGSRAWIACGLFVLAACGDAPDVGELDVVYATPAERLEIRAIRAGETLGGLLEAEIGFTQQQAVLMAFREQASPRRVRANTEVTLRWLGDEEELRGIDVALNPDETVRLTRSGPNWLSELVPTPVFTDTVYFAGEIDNSLWYSLVQNERLAAMPVNDRSLLVDHLDRVFQWQLDFSRQVQRGDYYRVAFERNFRPDGSMRSGHILAAEFVNVGTSFHAIWFDGNDDGKGSYYDLEGNSVRRSFLLKPLEFRRISSRFNPNRRHPVLNRIRAHRGVDYSADTGTPIMATANGVVTKRGPNGGLGNAVEIRHARGWVTRYGHLSRFARGISVGSRVAQGEVIGYVGMTGLATGPHLHYEMIVNGRHVDPLSVDIPAGEPVPSESRGVWSEQMRPRLAMLDLLPGPGLERLARSTDDGASPSPQRP